MNKLPKLYHDKQYKILNFALNNDFFMLINHGAKRTGKTILDNDLFLHELKKVKALATKEGVKEPQYILAGADLGALQRNVLNELTNKYGIEFKFDKHNRFKLFGVLVCCFGHSKINDLGRIRGMTAWGAYINEGTMANEEVFNEIKSRCSATNARMLIDTNPDHPEHWLKTNYIDKADGKIIAQYNWKLDENTFLSERYIDNIKTSTPSGMFTERDIFGNWVSSEGVVYRDFDTKIHYVDELPEMVRYFAGVDWGYDHYGVMVVIGLGVDKNFYLVEEHAYRHKEIEEWISIGNGIKQRYGNIPFYCDSARPEYIIKLKKNKFRAFGASKSILSGVESVARLYKLNRLFIYRPTAKRFREEIFSYIWDKKTGKPLKVNDDVQDGIRYAIYSDKIINKWEVNRKNEVKQGVRLNKN